MRLSSRFFRVAYATIFIGVFLNQVRHILLTTANDFVRDKDKEAEIQIRRSVYIVSNGGGGGGELGVVDGADMLRRWQPNSSYESLHLVANAVTGLPFAQEESIIILHCFPKMASSSLRR